MATLTNHDQLRNVPFGKQKLNMFHIAYNIALKTVRNAAISNDTILNLFRINFNCIIFVPGYPHFTQLPHLRITNSEWVKRLIFSKRKL